jgi:hypothetical protein
MSRTDNTMPWRIQEEDATYPWGHYPPPLGGAYAGVGKRLRKWWRAERRKVNMTLHKGVEPEPTRPRNFCRWDYW